jgi:hypothetical protein
MPPAFIQFHTLDITTSKAIGGAHLSATSTHSGSWQVDTNGCGDFFATLAPDTYNVTITAPGYNARVIPMQLGDSGSVQIGLVPAVAPPGDLPFPPPTRDEILAVRVGFQGETVTTSEYGTFPAFGPETTTLNDADLHSYCAQLRSRGWTHGEIAISWQYAEPGFLMPVPGRDLTHNLPELARRIVIMLQHFTGVLVFLAGDGMSGRQNPDGSYPYNDPTGWTYGYEWLCGAFPAIATYLQAGNPYGDLTKYCVFVPGYDGVFYGWGKPGEVPDQQPDRVVNFGTIVRQCLPEGYLAIEHSTGKIPVGEGGSDWQVGGRMMVYDCVLSEFTWPTTGDQVWQIVGRLNRPYHRPPDQPPWDDPNPPFYLAYNTPRGPVYYVPYEYATYEWTRGQVTAQQVQASRDYFSNMGCPTVC